MPASEELALSLSGARAFAPPALGGAWLRLPEAQASEIGRILGRPLVAGGPSSTETLALRYHSGHAASPYLIL